MMRSVTVPSEWTFGVMTSAVPMLRSSKFEIVSVFEPIPSLTSDVPAVKPVCT